MFLFALAWSPAALADTLSGRAGVVDSDVIDIEGQRIMLFGLESVERRQACTINGAPWECWAAAVRQLEALVDRGPVVCEAIGEPDVYGRILAECEIDGESLNEAYVRSGYAVARQDETEAYTEAEQAAREAGLGLWQGEFMKPWDYRTSRGIMVDRP